MNILLIFVTLMNVPYWYGILQEIKDEMKRLEGLLLKQSNLAHSTDNRLRYMLDIEDLKNIGEILYI